MYHTQTHTPNTNTVVALAQAETEVKLELQVGARLTDTSFVVPTTTGPLLTTCTPRKVPPTETSQG